MNQVYRKLIVFAEKYTYSVISCLYLHLFGIFSSKHRSFISDICAHFGYVSQPRTIIPQADILDIVPDENISVIIRNIIGVIGNVSHCELICITKLVKYFNSKKVFEIGTFNGRTTLNIASNCSPEAKVYTLDLPKNEIRSTKLQIERGDKFYIDKDQSGLCFIGTDCEKKILQLYGDSATFDFSPFINKMDLVFIDGSHSYEYVLNDSKIALKLLKDGKGILLWHDYGVWPGVTEALNKLYSEKSHFRALRHINGTSLVIQRVYTE